MPLIMSLPVLGWGLLILNNVKRWYFEPLWFAVPLLNLIVLRLMTRQSDPNLFWIASAVLMAIGILLVIVRVLRDYDLLLKPYFQTLGRLWTVATTIWWLGVLIIQNLG